MPTPIPQILSPYLSSLSTGSLLLITSVLNAPANWLVLRCILAALHRDQNAHQLNQHDTTQGSNSSRVVLLSFIRPLGLWIEIGKKAGLDISTLLANRRILYIDGLYIYASSASSNRPTGPFATCSHALKEVQNVLERTLEEVHKSTQAIAATTSTKADSQETYDGPILIIDGLDFLIASQPDLTAAAVSQMLTTVRQHVYSTILSVSSDGPLLHGNTVSTSPLEYEHQALIATLAHQSQLVMQLRGLDTGTAKDISGVVRISHGGTHEDEPEKQSLPEGEWLYKVSGDGSVRIWGRGE